MNDEKTVFLALEDTFKVKASELLSEKRTERIAWPRMVGMCALVEQFNWSTTEAARAFNRKDHTSALYAQKAVKNRTETSMLFRAQVVLFVQSLKEYRILFGGFTAA